VQTTVTARHGHLSDSHQQAIREKAEKLLHYFERITMIQVIADLAPEQIKKKVEIIVDAEHKHDFVANDEHEDLMTAVDLTFDRIKHQIQRYKERVQNHHKH
jgi:putative sigma-54 modulation protein